MARWWESNKKAIFVLLIFGLFIVLFLSTAFTRVSFETTSGERVGDNTISVFMDVATDVPGNFSKSFENGNFSMFLNNFKNVGIVWLVVMVIMIFKLSSKKEYANIEYGSAEWCTDREAYKILSPDTGMILAYKKCLPVIPNPPSAKNGNILVIGGSGSGKSASFAIPNAMQLLGSYVFTDPKGEIYDRTAGMFKKMRL